MVNMKLNEENFKENVEQFNKEAVLEHLPSWVFNVGANVPIARTALDLKDAPQRKGATCIIVAAGWSMTDEEVMKLKDFKGDIIVVNKSFERLYRLGVIPNWVCLLDAHAISASQFRWLDGMDITVDGFDAKMQGKTKFLISSTAYHKTVDIIDTFTDNLYMFNAYEDIGGEARLSQIFTWMNGKEELQHGGNVGALAFILARTLGYKKIALIGFDLYEEKDKNWTVEENREREVLYYPDIDTYVHIPFHFMAFMTFLCTASEDTKEPIVYLGKSPLFTHSPHFKTEDLDEFIRATQH